MNRTDSVEENNPHHLYAPFVLSSLLSLTRVVKSPGGQWDVNLWAPRRGGQRELGVPAPTIAAEPAMIPPRLRCLLLSLC